MRIFLLATTLTFLATHLSATTIAPFKDLGHLSYAADAIVLATAKDITITEDDTNQTYFQNFTVLQTIKGEKIASVPVRYFSEIKSGQYRSIAGEIRFSEGTTYLLFLRKNNMDQWVTACVSYYIFEEQTIEDQSVLVPLYRPGLLNIANQEQKNEPLHIFNTDRLITELKDVVSFKKHWDSNAAKVSHKFEHVESAAHKSIPSHCNLLTTNLPPRWQNMDTQEVPIYYQSSGSGCSNIGNEVTQAVDYMTSNYGGLTMNVAGSFNNYSPSCSGNSAVNGNFTNFVDTNLNGERSIAIIFNDPCNQIPNLSGCSGLLALGGLYFFTNFTHNYNGSVYSRAGYGYVIVNNGSGACNCGVFTGSNSESNYTLLLTHELTHAIGFAHMDPTVINANMAARSCCANASVSNLDIQCVDFLYNVPPNQGCTDDAAENYDPTATSDNGSCSYCSNGIQDGDESGIDCGGSGPGCAACEPDLTVQDCGTAVISANNLTISGIQVRNIGNSSSASATLGYYLSTNRTITTSDFRIGTDNISALSPGAVSNESFSITLSSLNVPEGNYYIGMIADYNNLRNESDEFNNSCFFSSPLLAIPTCSDGIQNGNETGVDCGGSCTACFADIVMDNCGSISITNTNISGTNIIVKNVGNGTSSAVRLGYYLSLDQKITINDYFLGSDFVNSLNAGETSSESFNFSLSNYPNIPLGEHYVGMIADYQDSVVEEDENNNSCFNNSPRLIISACGDGIMNGGETGVDCGGPHCPRCACQNSITYRNDISQDLTRHSRNFVRTEGSVSIRNSSTVHLIARNNVSLAAGFEVTKGSVVILATEGCID